MRSWIHLAEMSFLQRVGGLSLRIQSRVAASVNRKESVKNTLTHVNRNFSPHVLDSNGKTFVRQLWVGMGTVLLIKRL